MERSMIGQGCLGLQGKRTKSSAHGNNGSPFLLVCMLAVLSCGVAGLAVSGQSSQVTKLRAPSEPVPASFFGLHIHHLWQPTAWPEVPFGSWRLWDAHVTWALLEPQRDVYDFKLLDRYVEASENRHVQLMLTLAGTPTWASARPSEIPVHEGGGKGPAGSAAEPASDADWRNFVRTVATRYRGRIVYYEIWNEPMFKPFYSGSISKMVELTRSARDVLKEVDPSIQIISPPVDTSAVSISWLKDFLQQNGGDSVDIYGFHLYVPGPPELMIPRLAQLRAILDEHQQSVKPVWNTEAGWQMRNRPPDMAADYVARAFLVAWPLGVARYYFYAWDNDTMGIMPRGERAEMARAYRQTVKWMQGSTIEDLVGLPGNVWVEHLTLADGRHAKIAWSGGNSAMLGRDHIGTAKSYETLDGQVVPVQAGSDLPLTGAPILLLYE
jgi:hypothetical protein